MKTWLAIAFTIALVTTSWAVSWVIQFDITWIMIIATAVWASVDSSKIQLHRYKSGISYKPVVLFILTLLLWIVAFPWYLSVRHRISAGSAVLREAQTNSNGASDADTGAPIRS